MSHKFLDIYPYARTIWLLVTSRHIQRLAISRTIRLCNFPRPSGYDNFPDYPATANSQTIRLCNFPGLSSYDFPDYPPTVSPTQSAGYLRYSSRCIRCGRCSRCIQLYPRGDSVQAGQRVFVTLEIWTGCSPAYRTPDPTQPQSDVIQLCPSSR